MAEEILPDETDERDIKIYLKVALDAEAAWHKLCADLESGDAHASFLDHVVRRVPFYQERIASSLSDLLALNSFPIIRREQYNDSPEQFLADLPEPTDARLCALTNGTIAPELRVQFDPAGWYELNYGTYSAVASVIPGLLERIMPGEEGVFLVTNASHQSRMSIYVLPLNASILRQLIIGRSASEDALCVEYLRARPDRLLYGKPSNLLQLAAIDAQMPEQRTAIRPFAILVSGESLYEDQRKKLEDWFQCAVFNAYIATEGGLIAIECPYRRGLHIREKFVYVEVLDDAGMIREQGKGEILITNLFNFAHTFVRYLLGDYIEVLSGRCPCGFKGRTIVKLLGREAEKFITPVGEIPAEALNEFLTGLPVKEFQLVQTGAEPIALKWVAANHNVRTISQINIAIHDWLKKRAWGHWVIPVPLNSITPRGGKQRRFIRKVAQ